MIKKLHISVAESVVQDKVLAGFISSFGGGIVMVMAMLVTGSLYVLVPYVLFNFYVLYTACCYSPELDTKIKVFLDDVRETPEGYVRSFWPEDTIQLLRSNNVSVLSLDHDLGDDDRGTGYDVLLWIEEQVFTTNYTPPREIKLHTSNSSAIVKMRLAIDRIYKEYVSE